MYPFHRGTWGGMGNGEVSNLLKKWANGGIRGRLTDDLIEHCKQWSTEGQVGNWQQGHGPGLVMSSDRRQDLIAQTAKEFNAGPVRKV